MTIEIPIFKDGVLIVDLTNSDDDTDDDMISIASNETDNIDMDNIDIDEIYFIELNKMV